MECTKYYDPTSGFGNNDKGKCVWVPDKMKCYAKLVATGGTPNYNDWAVDFKCHEKSNNLVRKPLKLMLNDLKSTVFSSEL